MSRAVYLLALARTVEGHPYPGQRYRHGWIPVPVEGADVLGLPAIDAKVPTSFLLVPAKHRQAAMDAVEHYAGRGHTEVNHYLRGDAEGRNADYLQRYVDGLDHALAHSSIGRDAVVWRGVSEPEKLIGPRDTWPANLTGLEWSDPAYQSTTTQLSIAQDFAVDRSGVLMRVRVPAGTPALKLSGWDRFEDPGAEGEILLPRGARYRVVADRGADPTGAHARLLDVELIAGSAP